MENYSRQKRRSLLIILAIYFVLGGVSVFFLENETVIKLLQAVTGLLSLYFTWLWCNLDAKFRDYQISTWLKVTIILFLVLGFVIYALKTRGSRGIITVLGGILFTGCSIGIAVLGVIITYIIATVFGIEIHIPLMP